MLNDRGIGIDTAHQRHVELDQIRLEIREYREAGIARAEVIDGGLKSERLVCAECLHEMRTADDIFTFDRLEDDSLDRKVGDRLAKISIVLDNLIDRISECQQRLPMLRCPCNNALITVSPVLTALRVAPVFPSRSDRNLACSTLSVTISCSIKSGMPF